MIGTLVLAVIKPLSDGFFILYALTGFTDVLDGWIARKTKIASEFGARMDSIADLLFYAVMLIRVFPALWSRLPLSIWCAAAGIAAIRIISYLAAAMKYHRFASLHTYLNKLTGIAVFMIPFFAGTDYVQEFCWTVCAVGIAASLEELVIHIISKEYRPNVKSIFSKRRTDITCSQPNTKMKQQSIGNMPVGKKGREIPCILL